MNFALPLDFKLDNQKPLFSPVLFCLCVFKLLTSGQTDNGQNASGQMVWTKW